MKPLTAFLLFFPQSVNAEILTVDNLVTLCAMEGDYALGFIAGVFDTLKSEARFNAESDCLPEWVLGPELKVFVCDYVRSSATADQRADPAAYEVMVLLLASLSDEAHCPDK